MDGNRIEPLDGGDEAYSLMLTANDEAKRTYSIFDNHPTGRNFAEALGRAVARGVGARGPTFAFVQRRHGERASQNGQAKIGSITCPWTSVRRRSMPLL